MFPAPRSFRLQALEPLLPTQILIFFAFHFALKNFYDHGRINHLRA